MTATEIIQSVRYCIDEEYSGTKDIDTTSMDNIITNKIPDAIRWMCLYAPEELLTPDSKSTSGNSGGYLIDVTLPNNGSNPTGETSTITQNDNGSGTINLSSKFIKLVRVRCKSWSRAITTPISEDSEEYLQWSDDLAKPTNDRPQAAIINTATKKLEVIPYSKNDTVEFTYISIPSVTSSDNSSTATDYNIPEKAKTAVIYYIAYLLLSAYGDVRAERMLEIARMNIGRKTNEE